MVMIRLTTLPTQATEREREREREDWIATEKLLWNYAPSGRNLIHPDSGLSPKKAWPVQLLIRRQVISTKLSLHYS